MLRYNDCQALEAWKQLLFSPVSPGTNCIRLENSAEMMPRSYSFLTSKADILVLLESVQICCWLQQNTDFTLQKNCLCVWVNTCSDTTVIRFENQGIIARCIHILAGMLVWLLQCIPSAQCIRKTRFPMSPGGLEAVAKCQQLRFCIFIYTARKTVVLSLHSCFVYSLKWQVTRSLCICTHA